MLWAQLSIYVDNRLQCEFFIGFLLWEPKQKLVIHFISGFSNSFPQAPNLSFFSLSFEVILLFLLVFFLQESFEVTLQFFGNDGFSIIIIFYVLGDFFYSHACGRVRLILTVDLTTNVYLQCCSSFLDLRSQFTQSLLNVMTSVCQGKWILALTERDRCPSFMSQLCGLLLMGISYAT